jgi:hypothetical protein
MGVIVERVPGSAPLSKHPQRRSQVKQKSARPVTAVGAIRLNYFAITNLRSAVKKIMDGLRKPVRQNHADQPQLDSGQLSNQKSRLDQRNSERAGLEYRLQAAFLP